MIDDVDKINKLIESAHLEDKRFLILSIMNILKGYNNKVDILMKTGWKHKVMLEIVGDGIHVEIIKD